MANPSALPPETVSMPADGSASVNSASQPEPRPGASSPWNHVFTQIHAMSRMGRNWDGYNADAPRPELLDAALRLARALSEGGLLAAPYVTPTRIGGVLFLWESKSHEVEMEIEGDGRLSFLYSGTASDESYESVLGVDVLQLGSREFELLMKAGGTESCK